MAKFNFSQWDTYAGVLVCFDENNKFVGYECYGYIGSNMGNSEFWPIGKNRIENLDWLYEWHRIKHPPQFNADYLYNLGIRCIRYYRLIDFDDGFKRFGMKYAKALELEREFRLNPHKLNLGVKEFMLWKVYG
jgi:hypothetical protein